MKTYSGYRAKNEDYASDNFVFVNEDGIGYPLNLKDSLDVLYHSPTGFNWGYGGSGPHQLALAILLNFTNDKYIAKSLHHYFVIDFITGFDDKWEINEEQIQKWLEEKKKEVKLV